MHQEKFHLEIPYQQSFIELQCLFHTPFIIFIFQYKSSNSMIVSQLQTRLEKLINEQDTKISRQVEALEESVGLKSGAKSPGGKKRK